jgi:hypothetical protein
VLHGDDGAMVISNDLTGNKRAENLAGRDLGIELESYDKNFTAVADYLWEVVRAFGRPNELPPPPSLVKPAQALTRKRQKKD